MLVHAAVSRQTHTFPKQAVWLGSVVAYLAAFIEETPQGQNTCKLIQETQTLASIAADKRLKL